TLLKLDSLIVLPYNDSEATELASVVLPAATFAETIGTYINFEGVVQLSRPAKVLKYQNREIMKEMAVSRLDKHKTQFDNWVNEKNLIDAKPSWESLVAIANAMGKPMPYQTAREIFTELALKIPALGGIDYKKIGKGGVKLEGVTGSTLQKA
ncbi:MAG: hypothetical protein IAF08_07305, partial [Rhizobacter sp.]|nr:hypothetical protein [Chlorobiales bacterium]